MDDLRKAQENGVVIGLKGINGVIPRMDIDLLLLQEPDTFNLFLLAFQAIQDEPASKMMGYFQIAGSY